MPDQTDIDAINDSIADGVQRPRSVSVDGTSVTQQSVADKILASSHAAQQNVASVNQLFGHRTRLVNGPRQ